MLRNKLIPYLRLDYIKIMEDFQILKINSMEKDELLVHLKNSESWLYDCYLKDECINLFLKTGGFIAIGLSDDDLFKIGVDITISQINKRYFFDIKKDDNILILKKVKSRIVNNIRNYFSPTRKINYQQFHNFIIQIEDSYENFEQIIFEIDLGKIDKESLTNTFKKVWEDSIGDMDFDIKDFEDLCVKFGFTPLDVLVYNPYIVPKMSKQTLNNSDYQLVLIFDEKAA
ncbi:hypothetical protein B0174_00890 [Arcobacter caeni]|uniref:Uncharacterized protein n=2 Tax=Arcobacter caeni TaxID=1912877 RepID=A0A363D5P9_9BACT|nr:hypothetical protein B0174_00890 [Arcobacter caeni]